MAANMKAVKLRIKSVSNTMQITKAMELVASSKLRKASCIRHFGILQWEILIFLLFIPEMRQVKNIAMW